MAYTTISKSTDHFNTLTYAGNGASPRSHTGVGFQPDFCGGVEDRVLLLKDKDDALEGLTRCGAGGAAPEEERRAQGADAAHPRGPTNSRGRLGENGARHIND